MLKSLTGGARHGYAIARWIRETTDDELIVEDRALYVSLHRMEERGWLTAGWGISTNNRRAKFYSLTGEGRKQLGTEAGRWERYAAAVRKVLQAPQEAG